MKGRGAVEPQPFVPISSRFNLAPSLLNIAIVEKDDEGEEQILAGMPTLVTNFYLCSLRRSLHVSHSPSPVYPLEATKWKGGVGGNNPNGFVGSS